MTTEPAGAVPRVALYARQSVEEDQGITQQIIDCEEDAHRRGWPVLAKYIDNDTSGTTERGPKTDWHKMLRAFDDGQFDILIVTETSRLTRNLTDVLDVTPPRRAMRVIVIRQGIDTAVDDFQLKLLVLVAENEVKLKAQRDARYARERRVAGHPSPGKAPHGYRWVAAANRDQIGTRYVIDEDEAQDVRVIFNEFLAGAPLGQIARDLNTAGRSTRKGARWRTPTIRRILMNPLYSALLAPSQGSQPHDLAAIDLAACTPGAWEALIERGHLVAARDKLVGVKPNHQGTARKWLLSGLAICFVCRQPVRSARGMTHPTPRKDGSGTAPGQRYHTYRCVNGHIMRRGEIIDEFISEVCIARLSKPDTLDLLASKPDAVDVRVLHAQRIALLGRRKSVLKLIASGSATEEDAEEALDDLNHQLRAVDTEIARAVTSDPLAELVGVADARAWWHDEERTLARRRAVVETLMTVVIHPVGAGKRITTLAAAADTVEINWKRSAT
ncbi:recombinase family protein [Brachybacterium fresconis]|uniref:DNA invertase Pin-like site-specific DNA recombinase n=1 Tax=Brachybacterium fresconis TaxID=173363 RepID=A0ABS4YJ51_9MICO|nr:recombinase family protein [Brachybacterium fresconis]MBP2408826.1 DNA invertase Pin-like site-specific DNA recombinase [Brachybacterium fresconis]